MSISDIKNNLDTIHNRSKDELVKHVHELLVYQKRLDNKIVSMQSEVRYLNRHLTKIRDLIDKTLKTKLKEDDVWTKKK